MENVIHWITEHKEENSPNSNVIREEGKKKHKKRKRPRIGVWRAKEAKPDERK